MSTVASIASWPTGTVGTGARAIARTGPSRTAAVAGDGGPHLGVGDDRQLPVGEAHEQRRGVRLAEPARGFASRQVGLAERRRAHDGRHRGGADVEQPVDGVAGAGEAHAHRSRDVGGARLGPEQPPGVGGRRAARRWTARALAP